MLHITGEVNHCFDLIAKLNGCYLTDDVKMLTFKDA